MRVGMDSYTIGVFRLDAKQTVDFCVEHELDGVMFTTAWELSEKLDDGEVRDVIAYAQGKGLYVEIGIPTVNPHRADGRVKELGGGDYERGLEVLMRKAALSGSRSLRTFIGGQMERYDENVSWSQMLTDTAGLLKRLSSVARELGTRFALETHADATTFELLRLIEQVGEGTVGICLDTGNLTMRLEDPLEAAKRVAPFVVTTHTKDSILFFGEKGFRWQARPCGQGAIPLREIIGELEKRVPDLNLNIEDHPRIYELAIYDKTWLSSYSDLSPSEFAALVRIAKQTEGRIAAGELSEPESEEKIPWEQKVVKRLHQSVSFLREVLRELKS